MNVTERAAWDSCSLWNCSTCLYKCWSSLFQSCFSVVGMSGSFCICCAFQLHNTPVLLQPVSSSFHLILAQHLCFAVPFSLHIAHVGPVWLDACFSLFLISSCQCCISLSPDLSSRFFLLYCACLSSCSLFIWSCRSCAFQSIILLSCTLACAVCCAICTSGVICADLALLVSLCRASSIYSAILFWCSWHSVD